MIQTSSSRNCNSSSGGPAKGHGFTLMEVLLVLFIISIMTGLVMVRLPSFTLSQDLDEETRRIEHLLQALSADAVLDSVEYGLVARRDGYEFRRYDDASGKWQILEEKPFHIRALPNNIRVTLEADSSELQLGGIGESDDFDGFSDSFGESSEFGAEAPPVLILSSGEMTPFNLTFRSLDDNSTRVLSSDGYGDLQWQQE